LGEVAIAWRLAWAPVCLWEVVSDCLSITCFVCNSSFLHLFKYISTHGFSHLCSFCSVPSSCGGPGREGAVIWSLAAARGQPITPSEQHLPGDQLLSGGGFCREQGDTKHMFNGVSFCYACSWGSLHVNSTNQRTDTQC